MSPGRWDVRKAPEGDGWVVTVEVSWTVPTEGDADDLGGALVQTAARWARSVTLTDR